MYWYTSYTCIPLVTVARIAARDATLPRRSRVVSPSFSSRGARLRVPLRLRQMCDLGGRTAGTRRQLTARRARRARRRLHARPSRLIAPLFVPSRPSRRARREAPSPPTVVRGAISTRCRHPANRPSPRRKKSKRSGAVSAWASPLARVASRAADALLSISRRSEGGAPAPRAPPSADANAANAVPVPGGAPVPGDGPYPPMAPSPGTDNPAMNRDVSAMEASAARASGGRTRGGPRAGRRSRAGRRVRRRRP